MLRLKFPILILLLSFMIQGCTPYNAPIFDLGQPPSKLINTHLVEEGDTLYSIAWRYDFNVSELAKINRLSEPYLVRKGQVINIDKKIKSASLPAIEKEKKAVSKATDKFSSSLKEKVPNESLDKFADSKLRWQRPVKGKIIKAYNPQNLRKGIEIQAVSGGAVKSASQGVVVYAGDGLRDYGKLVIIRHSGNLLSAYGHNKKLLVREGQVIDGSKIISKLGSSGRLYFEIRKDGKPINPLTFIK